MDLLLNCIVILLATFFKSGAAIECYRCAGDSGFPGMDPVEPNCFDPFNTTGIVKVQCGGQCFANSTETSVLGVTLKMVQRGCVEDATQCPPTLCQDVDFNAPEESGSFCSYCCDDELCNSMAFEQAASPRDSINCWSCDANITESMEVPSESCQSHDFNGENAVTLPCPSGMCLKARIPGIEGGGDIFVRTCDSFNLCAEDPPTLPSRFANMEYDCCDADLCNVGGFSDDDTSTTDVTTAGDTVTSAVDLESDETDTDDTATYGDDLKTDKSTAPSRGRKILIGFATVITRFLLSFHIRYILS